jgi:hypothetical protein
MEATSIHDTATSFVSRVVSLKPGESEARAQRFDGRKTKCNTAAEIGERLDNNARAAVTRAARQTGMHYKVERNQFITRSGDLMVTVIVTCFKDAQQAAAA